MATVARRLSLNIHVRDVGETLLTSKLQILQASGNRRPSIALSILTGRVAEQLSILENFYAGDPVIVEAPAVLPVDFVARRRPLYRAHTVYLSEAHLRDIDSIIDVLTKQQVESKRITRSAVLRQAIEALRTTVESDPAHPKSLLEND